MNEWLENYNTYTQYKSENVQFLQAPISYETISSIYSADDLDLCKNHPKITEYRDWLIEQIESRFGFRKSINVKKNFYDLVKEDQEIPLDIIKWLLAPFLNIVLLANATKYFNVIMDEKSTIQEKIIALTGATIERQKYYYRRDKILWIMSEWFTHFEVFQSFYDQDVLMSLNIPLFSDLPKRNVDYSI